MSPPTVSKAETTYPIFAATFAHNNPAILAVGGGGGAGRSGVPNAITCFDTSSRAPTLEPFAQIDLPRDEDSVTCLANLATKDGCILLAGINSSETERLKGKNQHLRAFDVSYSKRNAPDAAREEKLKTGIQPLSRTELFSKFNSDSAKKEGYQRLIRLSPPKAGKSGSKRIGVAASSLADKENELVVFSAVSNKPDTSDVIQRIALNDKEANDVDILEPEDGRFKIAYCQDYSVFIQDIDYNFDAKKVKSAIHPPAKRYEVPYPDTFQKAGRPKLRSIRWLSPKHILLVVNKPNRSGVQLEVLRLYADGMGSISWLKNLPRSAKAAVDADVARLDSDEKGAYQLVVAVATIDVALHILTVDYHGTTKDSLSTLRPYEVYKDVHPLQMTKVVFSPFFAPEASASSQSRPQYLRLASTSLGNTISVETFELRASGKRHILSSATTQTLYKTATSFAGVFIVLCLALMIQSLIDPEGNLTRSLIPASLQNAANINKPGIMYDGVQRAKTASDAAQAPVAKTSQRLRDILHLHRPASNQEKAPHQKALVIHHDPDADGTLSTEIHDGHEEVVKRHNEAKKWDELSHEQRKRWKDQLVDAGMWTVEEGETILKSIFFSEAAGLVGRVAQGVING